VDAVWFDFYGMQQCRQTTELYILWSELTRRKLSPTLATDH